MRAFTSGVRTTTHQVNMALTGLSRCIHTNCIVASDLENHESAQKHPSRPHSLSSHIPRQPERAYF